MASCPPRCWPRSHAPAAWARSEREFGGRCCTDGVGKLLLGIPEQACNTPEHPISRTPAVVSCASRLLGTTEPLRFLARGPMCCHRATRATHATSTRAPPPASPSHPSDLTLRIRNSHLSSVVRMRAKCLRQVREAAAARSTAASATTTPPIHRLSSHSCYTSPNPTYTRSRTRRRGRTPPRPRRGGGGSSRMITGLPLTVPTDPATAKAPWIIR